MKHKEHSTREELPHGAIKFPDVAARGFLPFILKKRNIHTRNPFLVKVPAIKEFINEKSALDGYKLLKISGREEPDEVFRVNLSNQNFIDVNEKDMNFFIHLHHIDFSENSVDLSKFTCFPALKSLRLQMNSLKSINLTEENLFPKLEELDLSFNFINFKSIENLQLVSSLRVLTLVGCQLRELPYKFQCFESLEDLNLSDNLFEYQFKQAEFWETVGRLSNLRSLNVSRNMMKGIHTQEFNGSEFKKLETLDLSYNLINDQNNIIATRKFKNLKSLIVYGNEFLKGKYLYLEEELLRNTGADLVTIEPANPLKFGQKQKSKALIRFPSIVRLSESFVNVNEKKISLGAEYLLSKSINFSSLYSNSELKSNVALPNSGLTGGRSFETDDAGFFLTEDVPNMDISSRLAKLSKGNMNNDSANQMTALITENEVASRSESKTDELNRNILSEMKESHFKGENDVCNAKSLSYLEFKRLAKNLLGEKKLYQGSPTSSKSAYISLKQALKTVILTEPVSKTKKKGKRRRFLREASLKSTVFNESKISTYKIIDEEQPRNQSNIY